MHIILLSGRTQYSEDLITLLKAYGWNMVSIKIETSFFYNQIICFQNSKEKLKKKQEQKTLSVIKGKVLQNIKMKGSSNSNCVALVNEYIEQTADKHTQRYTGNLEYWKDANSDQQVKDGLFIIWYRITGSFLLKINLHSCLTPNKFHMN